MTELLRGERERESYGTDIDISVSLMRMRRRRGPQRPWLMLCCVPWAEGPGWLMLCCVPWAGGPGWGRAGCLGHESESLRENASIGPQQQKENRDAPSAVLPSVQAFGLFTTLHMHTLRQVFSPVSQDFEIQPKISSFAHLPRPITKKACQHPPSPHPPPQPLCRHHVLTPVLVCRHLC